MTVAELVRTTVDGDLLLGWMTYPLTPLAARNAAIKVVENFIFLPLLFPLFNFQLYVANRVGSLVGVAGIKLVGAAVQLKNASF